MLSYVDIIYIYIIEGSICIYHYSSTPKFGIILELKLKIKIQIFPDKSKLEKMEWICDQMDLLTCILHERAVMSQAVLDR